MDSMTANTWGDLEALAPSFKRSLTAANRSPRTIKIYQGAVTRFAEFLRANGMPSDVASLRREHVEHFISHLVETRAANTAGTYYRSLRVFFEWLLEEGEIERSPMERMKPPKVPEVPVPIVTPEEMRSLLKTCNGTTFQNRRDKAILMLLYDTGMRAGEIAGLRVPDVDFELAVAIVMGKGRRPRSCPFGATTSVALDRYLHMRVRQDRANSEDLWLGQRALKRESAALGSHTGVTVP